MLASPRPQLLDHIDTHTENCAGPGSFKVILITRSINTKVSVRYGGSLRQHRMAQVTEKPETQGVVGNLAVLRLVATCSKWTHCAGMRTCI